jgi:hypothetical protein
LIFHDLGYEVGEGRNARIREGKGREGKGREGKGREGKGREGRVIFGYNYGWSFQ